MKKIPLSKGRFVLVDDEDFKRLSKFKWSYNALYAIRSYRIKGENRTKRVYMHREILGAKNGQIVDHVDGDRLNNQKKNLRFCTAAENGWNRKIQKTSTSKLKGVSWRRSHQKWFSAIRTGKEKRIFLGYFSTKKEAYQAYCTAAIKYHGEYANFG